MRRALFRLLVGLLVVFAGALGGGGSAAAAPQTKQATPPWSSPLPRPLDVVRGFDDPQPYAAGHRGVDLAAAPGAAIRSPGSGTVRFAGPVAGRPVVSVDSGGLRFSYEPVLPRVRVGQHVLAGTVLGFLISGHPGCRPAPGQDCLHWGVRRGTRYLDPLRTLRVRVRLLPLEDGTTRLASEQMASGRGPGAPTGPAAAACLGVGTLLFLAGRRGR